MTDPQALPPLPTLGAVGRRPPPAGARREWVQATVVAAADETPSARTLRLQLPAGAEAHLPGQHYVVRRRREDGSWAQRSYSAASAPQPGPAGPRWVELTAERLDGGELSPYLHAVGVGEQISLRGPFGGWFVWRGDGPSLLLGGGSGVVPLMAMLRTWRAGPRRHPLRMVVSARSPETLFYAQELTGPAAADDVTVLWTRQAPAGPAPGGPGVRRLGREVLEPLLLPGATCYVCGSWRFTEAAESLLVDAGVTPDRIRVERFGPS